MDFVCGAGVKEKKGEITDVENRIASGLEEANETKLAEIEKVVKESKDEITGVKNETIAFSTSWRMS